MSLKHEAYRARRRFQRAGNAVIRKRKLKNNLLNFCAAIEKAKKKKPRRNTTQNAQALGVLPTVEHSAGMPLEYIYVFITMEWPDS